MKRLLAVALMLSACGGGYIYPTAAPAIVFPDQVDDATVEDAAVEIAPVVETFIGLITFGTSYDLKTLDIPKPLTRFKRTYRQIAWSADLARGVNGAFVSWTVVRRSESGEEETMFEVDEPMEDSTVTNLANSGDLASIVGNRAGMYVMRYIDSGEILAAGTFTLVE